MKYQRLMDGLEAVEMRLNEVMSSTVTIRFDPEYYAKKYLFVEEKIKSEPERFCRVTDLELVVDGSAFYPALEPYYNQGSFPFLRVGDVKQEVQYDSCLRIPKEILPSYPTLKCVYPGDILLTKGGSIANAGLVTAEACVSRDLIFINSSQLPEKDYVALFLYFSTPFAFNQLVRSSSQSAQPHLTLTLVKDHMVFMLSDDFKQRLLELYKTYSENYAESRRLYLQAQTLLLSALNLQNWRPSTEGTAVRTFKDSFLASGRLDAEYYQPKYEELEQHIKASGTWTILGAIRSFNSRGLQPVYVEGGEFPVVNSKHILEETLDYDGFERTSARYWNEQSKAHVRRGDILTYTTGANIGRTQVYQLDTPALASNHVNIIRLKEENPFYVGFVLNSKIGRMQTEKRSAGSAQAELYPKDLDEFLIPIVEMEIQEQIVSLVDESHRLRTESRQLLELAKRAVEVAIEEGEESAMNLLYPHTT